MFALVAGLAITGVVTALQYLLFQYLALVVVVTILVSGGAVYHLTLASVRVFAKSIVYYLGLESGEGGAIYKEVGV